MMFAEHEDQSPSQIKPMLIDHHLPPQLRFSNGYLSGKNFVAAYRTIQIFLSRRVKQYVLHDI